MVRRTSLKDSKKKDLTQGQLNEILQKFEPGEDFHKFRNIAIFHSFEHNYDLYLQKSAKQSS